MVAYTITKQLAQVANSSYVGDWDIPTNSNWGIVDAVLGQVATVSLNNSPVVLSAGQFQCSQITFNSTMTGNVAVTFPTSFTGPYIIENLCTGSSAFVITLQTTAAGGQVIGCPFGDSFYVVNDGTNIKFRNFGRVGTYWDYAGSSVPAWNTACTVPPYLNCDGTSFSSAANPTLTVILGGTTLPDARGRNRFALNQGTGRITTASGGLDGNTLLAGGGAATITLGSTNLPASIPYTDPQHAHPAINNTFAEFTGTGGSLGVTAGSNVGTNPNTAGASIGITINPGSPNTPVPTVPPGYIGGITMIRAG